MCPPISDVIRRKRKLLESAIKADGETSFMTRFGLLEYNFLSPVVAEQISEHMIHNANE